MIDSRGSDVKVRRFSDLDTNELQKPAAMKRAQRQSRRAKEARGRRAPIGAAAQGRELKLADAREGCWKGESSSKGRPNRQQQRAHTGSS